MPILFDIDFSLLKQIYATCVPMRIFLSDNFYKALFLLRIEVIIE